MNKEEKELFKAEGIVDFGAQADELVVKYVKSAKDGGRELSRQEKTIIKVGVNKMLGGMAIIDAVFDAEEK